VQPSQPPADFLCCELAPTAIASQCMRLLGALPGNAEASRNQPPPSIANHCNLDVQQCRLVPFPGAAPLSGVTGLTDLQLERPHRPRTFTHPPARRFSDSFKVAAATLMFDNPAVWWLSKTNRAERENLLRRLWRLRSAENPANRPCTGINEEWRVASILRDGRE